MLEKMENSRFVAELRDFQFGDFLVNFSWIGLR